MDTLVPRLLIMRVVMISEPIDIDLPTPFLCYSNAILYMLVYWMRYTE